MAWLLMTLGLLGVLGAGLVGLAAHDAALGRGGSQTLTPVRAVLLADVRPAPPRQALEAAALGIGAALTVAAMTGALLCGSWAGVRRATARRNDAAWAREWARVEPVWSRRQMR